MKKAYKFLLAALAIVLGGVSASAVKADLDPSMFKAWDGFGANANVVVEPDGCPNSDGTTSPFGCDYKLLETVGAGASIFGNTNVYYLWYADVTGTNTITFEGTSGVQLRVLMNRPAPGTEEGADPHGGSTVERTVTLDANGVGVIDVSDLEFVHINCIKTGWGSPEGVIRLMELEGSVKPVTGWVDLVSNGDMEGDDVSSFVVALNAVADQGTYPATIVDGAGVNGSRAVVVESMDNPTESWQTQFFIKLPEPIKEGAQWRLSMDIKADIEADCGSGCHVAPRTYITGSLFDPNPHFTTEWQNFEATGILDAAHAGSDGLGSIAFDLNVLGTANKYYFDNVHFEIYEEPTPLALIKAEYESDVIRVNFGRETNLKQLITNSGSDRLLYDSDVTVTVNGEPTTFFSVEGRNDGYLWIFVDENYPANGEEDVVEVSFNNPEDPAKQIVYTAGKYVGEPVPSFNHVLAIFNEEERIGEEFSYLLGTPLVETAEPEDGSFNLPADLKEFKYTFTTPVDVKALSAKFDKENLTITPATGHSREITLTRTSTEPLSGVHTVTLSNVISREDQIDEAGNYTFTYSFGEVVIDPDDQPYDLLSLEWWNSTQANGIPTGFIVKFGEEMRDWNSTYGSGSRTFDFGEGGDFTKGLYFREGYAEYGSAEGYELSLQAGKKYNIHFNSAKWKDSGSSMTFRIMNVDDPDTDLLNATINNTPNVNGSTAAVQGSTVSDFSFTPEFDGNYLLRWDRDGFNEVLLANVTVKYVPNVMGVEELTLVNTALENAKNVLKNNSNERYDGAAYDALDAAIKKYDGVVFTAPSVCKAAAAELDAAAKGMTDHRTLCDTYDPLPDQAQSIVDAKAETKFARTELYQTLKALVEKYAEIQTIQVEDPETGEVTNQNVVVVKVIKDDAELNAAVNELKTGINQANEMFTEGPSAIGDWSGTRTGYAPLTERLRLGSEALKSLGVAEDDALVKAGYDALSDDDALAYKMKNRIKKELYGKIKNGEEVFAEHINDETGEVTSDSYNMTVFVKNPNLYKLSNGNAAKEGAIPGWDVINDRGYSTGWSEFGSATVPVDAMFSNWGGDFNVSQTLVDLPAGVYTLKAGFGERDSQEGLEESYLFAKNSSMVEDSLTATIVYIGQSFPTLNLEIPEITVVDGQLKIGVQASNSSHAFFNDVQLLITATAAGADYNKLYEEVLAGIDVTAVKPASVKAIELYDLNGRRVSKLGHGVGIMRKIMSDGTVQTVKVVLK